DGLNNLNGVVSGQQGVQLNLGQLNNTGAGSLYAKSSLGLNVNGTLNNDQGVVRSDGTMDLRADRQRCTTDTHQWQPGQQPARAYRR
ncbi:filamentous hemagglutinin, intein-containing, partial [Pseudomonas syringae pv. actinidiae ICMP 19068]